MAKVLVLEPESAILRLIEILLSSEDYEVSSAFPRDGVALNGIDAHLILIDIAPPYEKGLGMRSPAPSE